MSDLIRAAEAEQLARAPHVDPRWRPRFHITAPAGWINDPNGMCWFAGEYHVFYQFNPYGTEWGTMHWGHASSTDLVNWRNRGVAMAPDAGYDADGCYSGSAVVLGEELVLLYTGHREERAESGLPDPARFDQTQNVASSRDGVTFVKDPRNPALAGHPQDGTAHLRDPKVWRHREHWYMVLGNEQQGGTGRALLYRSPDLWQWQALGAIAESDGSTGYMWECPDLFELDGRHVLVISPMGVHTEGHGPDPQFHAGALVGSFDYDTHRLDHGPYTEMDWGHEHYAVQTMAVPDGRRIAIGWMMPAAGQPSEKGDGWAGVLTLPRELHVTPEDRLTMRPIAELELLRGERLFAGDTLVEGQFDTGVRLDSAEILIDADLAGSIVDQVGFTLDLGAGAHVHVGLDRRAGELVVDRGGPDGSRRARLDPGERLLLRAFVDRSTLEVFTGSGLVTMSSRIYPSAQPRLALSSAGGPTRFSVEVFAMRAMQVDDVPPLGAAPLAP